MYKMIIKLIFLIFIKVVLSINYWIEFNETIFLDSNIANNTQEGVFWNFYNNSFNNSFNNIATCGKVFNICSCSNNYNTSLYKYNITDNCSLTILSYDKKIFNTTFQIVYSINKINYTIKSLIPVTSPIITFNKTNSLITCKKDNGTNTNIYLEINNTIVQHTNESILNYYYNCSLYNNFTATCIINNTINSSNSTQIIDCTNTLLLNSYLDFFK